MNLTSPRDMKEMFDLSGRTALVTGATQGLGLAIAQALNAHGARVLVSDRDPGACRATAEQLAAICPADSTPPSAIALPADLSDPAAVDALCHAAGPIDILVCNAGLAGPAGPLGDATDEDWNTLLQVNLRAPARMAGLLIPDMARRGSGSVILMSSIAGLRGNGRIGPYGITKAGVAQLARNLAIEWGPRGVRVNAISPGLIRTPMSAGLMGDEQFMARRLRATPLRRAGEPEEIAAAVVFLASRAGGFITAQNLVIDGGTLMSDGS